MSKAEILITGKDQSQAAFPSVSRRWMSWLQAQVNLINSRLD